VVDVNYGNEPDGPRADARAVVVVVCSGLPGTGKSRLAEGIARGLGISVFSVAWVLGALAPFGFL
jgi:adenylylsulfate kinase-like enzyme